ncbi:MAG: DUF4139 domain-containing protein [Bacteroidota bacterium]
MKKNLLVLIAILPLLLQSATTEKEIISKIDQVTVFTDQAQITRTANVQLSAGEYLLRFKGLSPYVNGQSVRIKGDGKLKIMSLRYQKNPAKKIEYPEKVQNIRDRIEKAEQQIEEQQTWINVLNEDERYIMTNSDMINEHVLAKPEDIRNMHDYFRNRLQKIRFEKLRRNRTVNELRDSVNNMQSRINSLNSKVQDPSGEVLVEVSVNSYTTAEFQLTFLVKNAGWYPGYDVRVEKTNEPVELTYKANIFQNTGIAWENVTLQLSNASPRVSGVMPELTPYFISPGRSTQRNDRFSNPGEPYNAAVRHVSGYTRDAQTGEPLPYVSIRAGASETTTSDANGYYSIAIPQNARYLEFSYVGYNRLNLNVSSSRMNVFMSPSTASLESVQVLHETPKGSRGKHQSDAEAFKTPEATVEKQPTSVRFNLNGRHNIDNSGKAKTIVFQTLEIPATYEYQCVPLLDEHAYLYARVYGWEDLNLISGQANIYFENTLIGNTSLNINQMADTLLFSLGQDQNITVHHTKLKDFSKKQILGSNIKVSRKYKLSIRNNKAEDVELKVFDQVPVSRVKDVEVDIEELSGGKLNESNGIVQWNITVNSKNTEELELGYQVKYPKSLNLHIR